MTRLLVATAVPLMVSIALSAAAAQSAKDLAGTYTLVSAITEKDGTKSDTFGPNAKGVLSLDANGHYVLTIIGASLPKVASNNRSTATPEENKAIVGGSIAHFGTVSISDKTIIFKVESATFPNWNGTEQKRAFSLTGDELKYTVAAASAGGTATVTWRRAK
jgi:Lipocalin-like domain